MNSSVKALLALAPAALLLSGCAMSSSGVSGGGSSAFSISLKGKTMGGQKPVANATYYLYEIGTSGYGSTGKMIASTTGDATGGFDFGTGLACDSANSSLYILSVGGDAGFGTNSAIVEGAGIGSCAGAANASVNISEITTAAMAYTFAQFFSVSSNDGNTRDHFGEPAASSALDKANAYTLPVIVNNAAGLPNTSSSTVTLEAAKLQSLGNLLGSCVNTGSASSTGCTQLFGLSAGPLGTPQNTLEAAVSIALKPYNNVMALFNAIPKDSAFGGGLATAPNDWSIAVAYTSPSLALALDNKTISTIDIDSAGRIWFPSNMGGARGLAYFDPTVMTFSVALNSGLTHPEQVAIDAEGVVWGSDTQSSNIVGVSTTSGAASTYSIANTTSTALSANLQGGVTVGLVNNGTSMPGFGVLKNNGASYTYAPTSFAIPGSGGFVVPGLASDVEGGMGFGASYMPTPSYYNFYSDANGNTTFVNNGGGQDVTGAIFTGSNYLTARAGYTPTGDALCSFDTSTCYGYSTQGYYRPMQMAIDGTGTLWMAQSLNSSVGAVFPNGTSEPYVTGGSVAEISYLHNSTNGNTMTTPTGIAIDNAGNVWTSNAGCTGTGCTPGSFMLSEIIGAAAPTITPLVGQISNGNLVGTKPYSGASPLKTQTRK